MYLPNYQKLNKRNDVYVERTLPFVGYINAKLGQVVEPFTKVGLTRMSLEKFELGTDFQPAKGKGVGSYFYAKEKVGLKGYTPFRAPYSGYLNKYKNSFHFEREPNEFWLLSGVWGEVVGLSESRSVLIKTQSIDVNLAVCTDLDFTGELIVFPNPSDLLVPEYLQKFTKAAYGTILYVGSHVTVEVVAKALEMGATAVIGGGVERECLVYGKQHGIFVGGIMGFGNIKTPHIIFENLKAVSSRHVFLYGSSGFLRIPVPKKHSEKEMNIPNLPMILAKVGHTVLIINKDKFGETGVIEKINKSSIVVRLDENSSGTEFSPGDLAILS